MIPLNLIMSFYAVSEEAIKQKGSCPRLTCENGKYLIAGLEQMVSLELMRDTAKQQVACSLFT